MYIFLALLSALVALALVPSAGSPAIAYVPTALAMAFSVHCGLK